MSFKAAFSVIEVLLSRPLFQCFDYKLEGLHSDDIVGARVEVNIAGSREIGIVYKVKHDSILPFAKLKQAKLLDKNDIFAPDLHKMLSFASKYYLYPLGQCYMSALPKLLRDGKEASYGEIPALAATKEGLEADCKNLKAKVQAQILSLLKEGPVKRKELRERGFSAQAENALIKKGFAVKVNLALSLKANKNIIAQNVLKEEPPVLNPEQSVAVETICATKGYQAFLLNGVTGSGKTEVYLQVIASVLKKGQSALVLVPEIALTPQTFERFYNRFNVPVSSMHSALSDRERLDALLGRERFDVVVNLAAQAGVRYSLENPRAYVDSNIVGFLNVLEGCRHHKVKHLVYASSSSVYGLNANVPFKEDCSIAHPVSLYAATKKGNELMAHVYSHLFGIPTTGLRFFTVYGPWGRPDMSPHLFTGAILKGRPIKVFNHGDMLRDFTYIDDIIEGVSIH